MRRHLTLPNLLATLLLVAAMAQTAPAAPVRRAVAKLITGKQVKDGSLTGADVKNGSLSAKKLAPGVLTQGAAGAAGANGVDGAKGAAGDKGAQGDQGAAGGKGATGAKGAPGTFRSGSDARDLYAWPTQTVHDKLNVVATFGPSQSPQQALEPVRFDDDLLYEIHVFRGPSSLADVATYQFRFTTHNTARGANHAGYLSPQLANDNQTYTVRRILNGVAGPVLGPFSVAPPRYGTRSETVFGQTYDETYADGFIHTAATGIRVWAGPRDDPAFVDTAAMADLYDLPASSPTDGNAKHNVNTIALELTSTQLTFDGNNPNPGASTANELGLWSSTSRLLDGSFTQVSRAGQPMFEQLMIPPTDKASYEGTTPSDDAALWGDRMVNPLLVQDFKAIGYYQSHGNPSTTPYEEGRVDILDVFNEHNFPTPGDHNVSTFSSALRLDLGLDGGWPNGRLLTDDTTDTMLSLIIWKLANPVPDGVTANDTPFLSTMPWAALPWRPKEG